PASLSYQLTVVANSTPIPTSATKKSGDTSIASTPANTQQVATKKTNPTQKPKKTKDPGTGGGTDPVKTKKPKK
ncbi:MAG TPA: hypothetical protein VKP08_11540, partial [Anaerolineales bacterium]|nr:hypothetical protein [Anaerolineales bacterium]